MAAVYATVNEQAMQLSLDEKRALIDSLVISMDCDPEADPEEIARRDRPCLGQRNCATR